MDRQSWRPLWVTAAVLVLVVPIFIAAGLLVRGYVRGAFAAAEQVRTARIVAFDTLKLQLDEETGIRGYAATRDRTFLEPYRKARAHLPAAQQRLAAILAALSLPRAGGVVADAVATSREWEQKVASPLAGPSPTDPLVIQRDGKRLMDHYRADLTVVDQLLAQREALLDSQAEGAITRISLYVVLAVIVLSLLGIAYGIQQTRLAWRLAAQQREAAALRAAYETERRIAETLQDAFLQRPLPTLPAVSFSATYVPAAEQAKVGGDWYDGVELAPDRVLFAIGDVAGHGLEAAVAMNRARQALISAAVRDPDPARLLTRVNRELLARDARMVTVVCGYADSRTFEFTYASAGHPPPVLIEPGRPPRLLELGGLPLGVLESAAYTTMTVQTVPGAMLVLYTDGAVEHSRDVLAGETMLLDAVARAVDDAAPNVAAAIHRTIFDGRDPGDDVAILTVTFSHEGVGTGGAPRRSSIVATGSRGTNEVTATVVTPFEAPSSRRRPPSPWKIAS
ncbi:MAG TPA: SpoIIE family protein phosphatase [Candidatus Elarobacter sp.]|jgi:serine phosphatase RsbU (regulator of sigma subunit)